MKLNRLNRHTILIGLPHFDVENKEMKRRKLNRSGGLRIQHGPTEFMCDEDTGQDLRAGRLSFLSTTLVSSYFSISELIIRLGAMKGSDFLTAALATHVGVQLECFGSPKSFRCN